MKNVEIVDTPLPKNSLAEFFKSKRSELATPDELAALKELEKGWVVLQRQQTESDNDSVRRAIQNARNEYQRDPSAPAFQKLQRTIDGKQMLGQRQREVRRQTEAAIRAFATQKVFPIVSPILKKAAILAAEFAKTLRRQEEDTAKAIGVVHSPSAAVQAVETLARNLGQRASGLENGRYEGEASPKSLLKNLVEL